MFRRVYNVIPALKFMTPPHMSLRKRHSFSRFNAIASHCALAIVFCGVLFCATPAAAWVLTITPGAKAIYLQVGNGANNANNATINRVNVTVPANAVGNATPQVMTTNSTASNSFFDNFAVCNVPAQVYVGGYFRQPSTTAAVATLQVSSPPNLTSGTDTIPFTQISWTSTANGTNPAADIPAGTFSGGTQFLVNVPSNRWLENCHTFRYANTNVVPAGVFTGRATYTLVSP
jgi:hypothetical protein